MSIAGLGALGIGFVLGARAGRERYERIREMAQRSAERLEAYGAEGSLALRAQEWGVDTGPAARRRTPAR